MVANLVEDAAEGVDAEEDEGEDEAGEEMTLWTIPISRYTTGRTMQTEGDPVIEGSIHLEAGGKVVEAGTLHPKGAPRHHKEASRHHREALRHHREALRHHREDPRRPNEVSRLPEVAEDHSTHH